MNSRYLLITILLMVSSTITHAKEGDLWKIYINTGDVLEFKLLSIAPSGIQSEDGSGVAYSVIDSVLIQDYADVNTLTKYLGNLGIKLSTNGIHINFTSAEKLPNLFRENDSFMANSRTQFILGNQIGIIIDLKKSESSNLIWRVEGNLIKVAGYTFPLGFSYSMGVGGDIEIDRFSLTCVGGYLLFPTNSSKRDNGYIHPAIKYRLSDQSKFTLYAGTRIYSNRLKNLSEEIETDVIIGFGMRLDRK